MSFAAAARDGSCFCGGGFRPFSEALSKALSELAWCFCPDFSPPQVLLTEACALGWAVQQAELQVLSNPALLGLLTPAQAPAGGEGGEGGGGEVR